MAVFLVSSVWVAHAICSHGNSQTPPRRLPTIEKSRMIKLYLAVQCILSYEPAGRLRATTNFSRELYVAKEPKQLLSTQMHIIYQTRLFQGLLFMANLMEMSNQSGKVSMRSKNPWQHAYCSGLRDHRNLGVVCGRSFIVIAIFYFPWPL